MKDRAELIARLRSDVQTAGCDCERCELFRGAADQIEADGKRIADLEAAHANTVLQAQIQAQEMRTQCGIVQALLQHFGCPAEDWHAESLIKAAAESRLTAVAEAVRKAAEEVCKIIYGKAKERWYYANPRDAFQDGTKECADAIHNMPLEPIIQKVTK